MLRRGDHRRQRQRSTTRAVFALTGCRTTPTPTAAESSPRATLSISGSARPGIRPPSKPAGSCCPQAGLPSSRSTNACRTATARRPWRSRC